MRILINNHQGVPGKFIEATSTWFPVQQVVGAPDDIASADINHDGFIDIGVGLRFSSQGRLFLNNGGLTFGPPIVLEGGSGSHHDIVVFDANNDGHHDALIVNESGGGQSDLFTNNGQPNPGFSITETLDADTGSETGEVADFNADGFMDVALGGSNNVEVFFNNPNNPGQYFGGLNLSGASGLSYDLEAGDINLDGHVDLISANITSNGENTIRVWINNGNETFTNITNPGASAVFPGVADIQRLSADLIDFDFDGDLDFYVTGADGQNVGHGRGAAPNQFYENHIID